MWCRASSAEFFSLLLLLCGIYRASELGLKPVRSVGAFSGLGFMKSGDSFGRIDPARFYFSPIAYKKGSDFSDPVSVDGSKRLSKKIEGPAIRGSGTEPEAGDTLTCSKFPPSIRLTS